MTGFSLRPLRRDDADNLAHGVDNENIIMFLKEDFPAPRARVEALSWLDRTADEPSLLARGLELDGQFAGLFLAFFRKDLYRESAEIGFWLAEPFWGRGLAPRVLNAFCAEVFAADEGVERIYVEVMSDHYRACRALEKARFYREGVFRASFPKEGLLVDGSVYAKMRE